MKHESFMIQFHWQHATRELQIRTSIMETNDPVISLYEIFRDNVYLFSMYPTISDDSRKAWQIVETDRLPHLPQGFVGILGDMIDHFYTAE